MSNSMNPCPICGGTKKIKIDCPCQWREANGSDFGFAVDGDYKFWFEHVEAHISHTDKTVIFRPDRITNSEPKGAE